MGASIGLNTESLQLVADEVARSLSRVSVQGQTAFISTAVRYANGSSAVVRIDQSGEYYLVSDDGQANLNAEMFGGSHVFPRVASDVAKKFSVQYDQRSFFVLQVRRNQLPAAVAHIANASSSAVDRTIQAMERQRTRASKELFVARMTEAFGDSAVFEAAVRGSSKTWEVDAAVVTHNRVEAVFEFVTPAPPSIAFAHMKIHDISAMIERPKTIIVLSDYDKTEAPMRQILSSSADSVVSAKSSIAEYRDAA